MKSICIVYNLLLLLFFYNFIAIRLGFEKPEYTVAEEDELLDVYVTKNGVDSEQVLRVRVQNSPTGSAMEGTASQTIIYSSCVSALFPMMIFTYRTPTE